MATIVLAALIFFVLQDFPQSAKMLTEEERVYIIRGLREDNQFTAGRTESFRAAREARAQVLGKGIREAHQAAPMVTIPILEGSSTSQDPSLGRRPLRGEHDALQEW